MGACQATFGASTSGQGLSASQLAACIRAAARAGATLADAAAAPSGGEVDYMTPQTVELTMEDGPDKGTRLSVTSFAADAFRRLRLQEGISDAFFEAEWVLPEQHVGLRESEGRSRAMFLVSNHRCLLCKTVSEGEIAVLLQMLPNLMKHLAAKPNSLLQRFVLALRITDMATGEVGWVCVFTDIFARCAVLHEKWDLKGRVPKAAKYLFLPEGAKIPDRQPDGSSSSDDDGGDDGKKAVQSKRQLAAGGKKKKVVLVSDDALTAANSNVAAAAVRVESSELGGGTDVVDEDKDRAVTKRYGDGYDRVVARKDKELTRVFWLPGQPGSGGVEGSNISMRDLLFQAIRDDDDFLCANGVLDYSVLIGVTYIDPQSPFRAMRYNEQFAPVGSSLAAHPSSPVASATAAAGGDGRHGAPQQQLEAQIPCETRDTCDGVQMQPASLFHRGIHSSGKLELYHVGIIDMLTAYTFAKKSANFFKNFLWTNDTLSTVPPEVYRERAISFFDRVIVAGPPAVSATPTE